MARLIQQKYKKQENVVGDVGDVTGLLQSGQKKLSKKKRKKKKRHL